MLPESFSLVPEAAGGAGCGRQARVGAQTSKEMTMLLCVEIAGALVLLPELCFLRVLHLKQNDNIAFVHAHTLLSRLSDLVFINAAGRP